jgi:hypothetical protein
VTFGCEGEAQKLDDAGLSGAARPDQNIEPAYRLQIEAVEEAALNLNTTNNHDSIAPDATKIFDKS